MHVTDLIIEKKALNHEIHNSRCKIIEKSFFLIEFATTKVR